MGMLRLKEVELNKLKRKVAIRVQDIEIRYRLDEMIYFTNSTHITGNYRTILEDCNLDCHNLSSKDHVVIDDLPDHSLPIIKINRHTNGDITIDLDVKSGHHKELMNGYMPFSEFVENKETYDLLQENGYGICTSTGKVSELYQCDIPEWLFDKRLEDLYDLNIMHLYKFAIRFHKGSSFIPEQFQLDILEAVGADYKVGFLNEVTIRSTNIGSPKKQELHDCYGMIINSSLVSPLISFDKDLKD